MDLKQRWLDLCHKIHSQNGEIIWDWIDAAYTSSDRYYHTLSHLNYCFDILDQFSEEKRAIEIELALWFHDIIYDTTKADNEEESVKIAINAFGIMKLDKSLLETVSELIMLTKHSAYDPNLSESAKIFLDCDLAILGAKPALYRSYALNIRKEYEWVEFETYRSARLKILQSFLNRPKVFLTEEMCSKYNLIAKENLVRSIINLTPSQVDPIQ